MTKLRKGVLTELKALRPEDLNVICDRITDTTGRTFCYGDGVPHQHDVKAFGVLSDMEYVPGVNKLVEEMLSTMDTNRSCISCKQLEYVEDANLDGQVNECNSGDVCNKHPGYANLTSFPFKKNMKCFERRA